MSMRQHEIERELAHHGFRMEASLMVLEGDEGHALIELSSGDLVDPPNDHVLGLAEEWSFLAGVEVSETMH